MSEARKIDFMDVGVPSSLTVGIKIGLCSGVKRSFESQEAKEKSDHMKDKIHEKTSC
jgi:hypothetical protein